MTVPSRSLKELFLAALDVAPAERAAWLDRECAHDAALGQHLALMLAAHDEPQSLLDRPAGIAPSPGPLPSSGAEATVNQPVTEGPGTQIGPYTLMEQIGEGGMGLVFVAEQHEPVRRKVAMKVIKPAMDTRACIARFEAERQALALMDHPNISRVLDAGATASGRPYFVMELVKGVPITDHCDANRLTPRQRLELFTHVCHAVQHAHQKGIIHRDIKPSNVMVASHDGRPVVKVIDFGVAKAIGQQLTDRTVYTALTQMVGTPLYMSPEQAGLSSLDIDTRTDIYSLGVLLYELLTGTTPFDKERLKQAAFDEMRRIIREEEPQKPSTRISALSSHHAPRDEPKGLVSRSETASLASIAACRQMEPAKLVKLVRGELDWIVMKALEKDRAQRYETANGFAADLQRYLNDEQVQACPPSTGYRFRKFARRNRVALTTALFLAATLALATAVSTSQAIRATRAQHYADEQRAAAEHERQQAENAKKEAVANLRKARKAVDLMLTRVAEQGLNDQPGMERVKRKLLEDALSFYEGF